MSEDVHGDWREFVDSDTGRTYYHNASLGISQWVLPSTNSAKAARETAAAMPQVNAVVDVAPEVHAQRLACVVSHVRLAGA